MVGEMMQFLKENDNVHVHHVRRQGHQRRAAPRPVNLKVVDTEPAVKGATAAAQFKPAILENRPQDHRAFPSSAIGEMVAVDTAARVE